jgi:alanyl-tRNA synthetase
VEALVGIEAFRAFATERALVSRLTDLLKSPKEQLEERLTQTIDDLKSAQRKLSALQAGQLATRIPELVASAVKLGNSKFIAAELGDLGSVDELRTLVISIREKVANEDSVIAVFGLIESKPMLVVATTEAARNSGQKAGALVRVASAVLGGGGGGKDDIAQGGGSEPSKIGEAISAIKEALSA